MLQNLDLKIIKQVFYERADQRNLPDEVVREGGRVHRAAKAWDDVTGVLQPEINILDDETKLFILIQRNIRFR